MITGAGLVSSLGLGLTATWSGLMDGRVGLGPYTSIETPSQSDKGGGEAPPLPGADPCEPREAGYLRFAINEAVANAGLTDSWCYEPHRCGIMLGTTLHGMTAAGRMLRERSYRPLIDFLAPSVIARAAGHLPLQGFAATTCSACSSGISSILLGMTLLESGELDLVVAGGYDPISEFAYAGFNSLRLVDAQMPRPFSRDRAGLKVSEGYAIVVLERASDAQRRGASAMVTILGCGESADAHHLTQPRQDGRGAARAIENALAGARVAPDQIDLIVAHATGTPDNDGAEYRALKSVFGDTLSRCPATGLKSRIGHTLGGAGAVELVIAAMAIRHGRQPTTAGTRPDRVEFTDLNLLTGPARTAQTRRTLNTSLGFGGANACMVLGNGTHAAVANDTGQREVWITGVGVVLPGTIGNEAYAEHWARGGAAVSGSVDENDYLPLLNARRVRRMSDYVKLSLASTTLALRDADAGDGGVLSPQCAALLGTTHGSTRYCHAYYREIVEDGVASANPLLFAEGVQNAAAAHLSMTFGLRGPCQSIIGSRTAGLDALRLAALRIRSGRSQQVIVCAGEEYDPLIQDIYLAFGLDLDTCAASVALLLESAEAAGARHARCRAVVHGGFQVHAADRPARAAGRLRHMLTRSTCDYAFTSSNGTRLDRFENLALRRGRIRSACAKAHVAECFSGTPFAAIAGVLLTGTVPGAAERIPRPVLFTAGDFNGIISGIYLTNRLG